MFPGNRREMPIRISRGELTGALGDSVTVLPVVVAVAALTELALARLLLGFAVFQVAWGVHYGLPVSVEPMKALAALVIAGGLGSAELAVAGLLAGAVLLLIGATDTLSRVEWFIGRPVVRGVQLAVGLVLLEAGVELSLDGPVYALAALAVVVGSVAVGRRRVSALLVLALGVGIAVATAGLPSPVVPTVGVTLPSRAGLSADAAGATVAQLAMTVGNAAVATSLLLTDYYDADVSPDDLATSMGAMNLLAVPFGALPMCHGSGGVTGKYAFGARTAGSNLILGVLFGLAALVGVGIVAAFPIAMLGVILAVVGIELCRAGVDTSDRPLAVVVGAVGLVSNVGVAFLVGVVVHRVLSYRRPETASS
ncbi:putative sulfate/molybdate transporter [Halobellus ruber]|uniref:Sulfate transporter n=1 Tax=Halobellus ruber TaxID=2761102 RepID=A0A7J9SFZ5_9EURY|nr:putative sulfate/molybdate transporter [Halobellus ruber]MBB6645432.1 sulfate transporter [Halobellus ruber]